MSNDIQADVAAVSSIDAITSILEVICRTTGMGFAAVARVTEDRWVACAVRDEINFGLVPGGELQIATTLCDEIRESGAPVIIDHVAEDQAFCSHPTPALYGFQSYISMPIFRADRSFFGTLCAIDPKPAQVSRPEIVQMFRLFSDLIAFYLESKERVSLTEQALIDEQQTGALREQFIAVLGHDLRNPLASIKAGVRLIRKDKPGGRAPVLLDMVETSIARMVELIDNVTDFARGRLGGGISLNRAPEPDGLRAALEQVVQEVRMAWPDRTIETNFVLTEAVNVDSARMAQMLSNLVSNAITHGAPESPVRVEAATNRGGFELSVSNSGRAIPAGVAEGLFQPFFRTPNANKNGLGLGLYIANEIARAHGGALTAHSISGETRFTFTMPLN